MMEAPSELIRFADSWERFRTEKTSLYREAAAGRITLRKFGTAIPIAREDDKERGASLPVTAGIANAAA